MSQYQQHRSQLRDGDILAFRDGRSLFSRCVIWLTGSRYSHVGMVLHWGDEVYIQEAVNAGVRAILVSKKLASTSSAVDVFRPNLPQAEIEAAAERMRSFSGRPYGYLDIVRFLIGLLFGIVPIGNSERLFCSESLALAFGLPRADFISPGAFVALPFLEWMGTVQE